MTSVKVNRENKNIEISITNQIPFTKLKEVGLDLDHYRPGHNLDLFGAFSKRIIASLQRRMDACLNNLSNHIDDVVYADEIGSIIYKCKDGTYGKFNLPSYEIMTDCLKELKNSNFVAVLQVPAWIDQILKAFLNDTEMDHSDESCFKWSELVSLLTELHVFGRLD